MQIAFAQSQDFEKNPTASNLAIVENPTLNDFNRLPENEKFTYLSQYANFQNPAHRELADNYLKNLASINSNPQTVAIANRYFSSITGIPNVNLVQGNVKWDGSSITNGDFRLNIANLQSNAGITSMVSTADRIVLKYAEAGEVSLGGKNTGGSFQLIKNGGYSIKINNQEYKIPVGANLDVEFSDRNVVNIRNNGYSRIRIDAGEDINYLPFGQKDLTSRMIFESAELNPQGKVTIGRAFPQQNRPPLFEIEQSELNFRFERSMPTGEFYAVRNIVSADELARVEVAENPGTENILLKNRFEGNKKAVYLFPPSSWGGDEEKYGVNGKNLEEAFRMRAGAMLIGSDAAYSAVELDRSGGEKHGIIYSSSMEDRQKQGDFYFRYGIGPGTYVTEANGNKMRMNFPVIAEENRFSPFSAALKEFEVIDQDRIKPFEDRIIARQLTAESDGGKVRIAEDRSGLGRYSNAVFRETVQFESVGLQHSTNIAEVIETKIKQESTSVEIAMSLGDPKKEEDGRLYKQGEVYLGVNDQGGKQIITAGTTPANFDFERGSIEFLEPAKVIVDIDTFTITDPVRLRASTPDKQSYDIALQSGTYSREGPIKIPVSVQREGAPILENANLVIVPNQNVLGQAEVYIEGVSSSHALVKEFAEKSGPLGLPLKVGIKTLDGMQNVVTGGLGGVSELIKDVPIIGFLKVVPDTLRKAIENIVKGIEVPIKYPLTSELPKE